MKKLLIILLLAPVKIFAQEYQSFKGKVTDLETQLPLERAYIRLGNIGITTNQKGDFLLKIPPKLFGSILTISSMGYKNFTQKITVQEQLSNLSKEAFHK